MSKERCPKIQVTKNYRLFVRSEDNRPLDLKGHKKLFESMKKYGYLAVFPIVCWRVNGKLVVREGQHRLAIAESLGLPVYFVETPVDFNIAEINDTPKNWKTKDYAHMHASNGIEAYQEIIDFAELHGIPIGTSAALLAGTTTFGNIKNEFNAGRFTVKDRPWAEAVATLQDGLKQISSSTARGLTVACMRVCRVEGFDIRRMLNNAKNCPEKLIAGNADYQLQVFEEIYNYNRKQKVALKFLAEEAMRKRSAVQSSEKGD